MAKLEKNHWNISQTAREIDTPRSNLYKRLAQYGIKITLGVTESGGPAPTPDEKDEEGAWAVARACLSASQLELVKAVILGGLAALFLAIVFKDS